MTQEGCSPSGRCNRRSQGKSECRVEVRARIMTEDFCREEGAQRVSEDRQYRDGICEHDMLRLAGGGGYISD